MTDTEIFFSRQRESNTATSNHTLDTLKALNPIWIQIYTKKCWQHKHTLEKQMLLNHYYAEFTEVALLAVGMEHSLAFYGYGSKYLLLNQFANFCKNYFDRSKVIILRGFDTSFTLVDILQSLADAIEIKVSRGINYLIDGLTALCEKKRMFLVIHNIDSKALCSVQSQRALARISQIPRLHLLASYDHINFHLILDYKLRNEYKFLFHDWTTFHPYDEEIPLSASTSLFPLKKDIASILASQTPSSQQIFKELITLRNTSNNNSVDIHTLYDVLKDKYLCHNMKAMINVLKIFEREHVLKLKENCCTLID